MHTLIAIAAGWTAASVAIVAAHHLARRRLHRPMTARAAAVIIQLVDDDRRLRGHDVAATNVVHLRHRNWAAR